MITLTKTKKYLLVSLIPLLVLLSMCIPPLLVQIYGETVQLESRINPGKDTFRGRVLYLDYKISSIDKNIVDSAIYTNYKELKKDYINAYGILNKKNNYWHVSRITLEKPKKGQLYLKCSIPTYVLKENFNIDNIKEQKIYINYDLDKYFTTDKTLYDTINDYNRISKPYEETYDYIVKLKIYNGSGQVIEVNKK
ncbi:putative membrane-anchored protein [Clostridium tetanomorphum]|uniref:GDYXXLXY domain-containing protein n=1 Tax=Clostridium tetanomorphum TaxID=1553 RepID=A0A923J003_CLOTT|nr:GDYXXLXY domain-containing protein [Clostridium tetanomorphum]KAJ53697.1 membrane-anchored protein [Clostridium tetanomorphum DSM 665]MBC2397209.1 GDYXXLXY domain-containing protein [Clostridium tetanomorphum]MBP1862423.1 putative membrane-anchored protein [Clostridium tetanomorphum]NRS85737.1 putative membrane-anchored protein [Clostridium tetanomorphum]NRZ96254.1 putative membrane-anchored protein [Clostridium tetanomorphum]